jgi:hypothetical protein
MSSIEGPNLGNETHFVLYPRFIDPYIVFCGAGEIAGGRAGRAWALEKGA